MDKSVYFWSNKTAFQVYIIDILFILPGYLFKTIH